MKYYSTRNNKAYYSFRDALIYGLAKDGGLFVPETIPHLNLESHLSFHEIAYIVSREFLDNEISNSQLYDFINNIFTFSSSLVQLDSVLSVLELFHGPTLAFKDFGARFMAELMSYYSQKEQLQITVLVATSGDTGSAVANAFYKKKGIKVYILYPSKKVSEIQEKQLTTYDDNIKALEILGTFDDCQRLVKSIFMDDEIRNKINLASANSINIARLFPQTFYYLDTMLKLLKSNALFVVPSGNLGNLTAGLYAKKMIDSKFNFIAALNSNNVFQEYLQTGRYFQKETIQTISNAMDVGNPSNIERINDLYMNNLELIKREVKAFSVSDRQTKSAITECFEKNNYILDPHGAVGYSAIKQLGLDKTYQSIILLETAHPSKFIDVVEENINAKVIIPERLQANFSKPKKSIILSNKFQDLKEYLLDDK